MAGGGGAAPRLSPPTLLGGVRRDALVTREETFGPLAAVIAFDRYDDGIAMANDTPFGLARLSLLDQPADNRARPGETSRAEWSASTRA